MTTRFTTLAVSAALMSLALGFATSASAQSVMSQCSTKYQAAKAANTLNNQTWIGFLAQCRADLKAQPAAVTAPAAASTPVAPSVAAPAPVAPRPSVVAAPVAPKPTSVAPPTVPAVAGAAVFPTAIAPAYASLSAGVARRKTCNDQYKANKGTNGNGGMQWIQKGGGYYSECNKKLKGI